MNKGFEVCGSTYEQIFWINTVTPLHPQNRILGNQNLSQTKIVFSHSHCKFPTEDQILFTVHSWLNLQMGRANYSWVWGSQTLNQICNCGGPWFLIPCLVQRSTMLHKRLSSEAEGSNNSYALNFATSWVHLLALIFCFPKYFICFLFLLYYLFIIFCMWVGSGVG